jgi:hypothetical protein
MVETVRQSLFQGPWREFFLIEFEKIRDKERVLEGRPWVFEGCLFLTKDYVGIPQRTEFSFYKAAFWVQMINLPLACMGCDIGKKIGETVGTMEAVDMNEDEMGWEEYLCVKIQLDITKPLLRRRKLNIEGKMEWTTFQYECLLKFCFNCGVLSHGRTGCAPKSDLRHPKANPQYGPWLRMASPTQMAE